MSLIHKISPDNGTTEYSIRDDAIAPVELTTTASKAYSVGDQFILDDGKIYKATANIAQGGTITVGTNCVEAGTVSEQLNGIKTYVDNSQSGALAAIEDTVGWDCRNKCPFHSQTIKDNLNREYPFTADSDGYLTCSNNEDYRSWDYAYANEYFSLKAGTYKVRIIQKTAKTSGIIGLFIVSSGGTAILEAKNDSAFANLISNDGTFTLATDTNVGMMIKVGNGAYAVEIVEEQYSTTPYTPYHPPVSDVITDVYGVMGENGAKNKYNGTEASNTAYTFVKSVNRTHLFNKIPSSYKTGDKLKIQFTVDSVSNLTANKNAFGVRIHSEYSIASVASTSVVFTTEQLTGVLIAEVTLTADLTGNATIYAFITNDQGDTATVAIKNLMVYDAVDTDTTYQPYSMTNRELTEKFPTSYISSGLTFNNCTYVAGGYCKIGKLVVLDIRVKVTDANTDVEITGFPSYSNQTLNSKNIVAVNALNMTDDSNVNYCAVMGVTGSLRVKNPLVANKEYAMSTIYLAD